RVRVALRGSGRGTLRPWATRGAPPSRWRPASRGSTAGSRAGSLAAGREVCQPRSHPGKRGLAILQHQFGGPVLNVRLVDRPDHLQRRPPVVDAVQVRSVLLDRRDQVVNDEDVPVVALLRVERLRLAQAARGDLLPWGLALAWHPARVLAQKRR